MNNLNRVSEILMILKKSKLSFADENTEEVLLSLKNDGAKEETANHEEPYSYMAKPQLYAIANMAAELHRILNENETLPDWAESHIAKCEQMMQSVYNKLTYDKRNNGNIDVG